MTDEQKFQTSAKLCQEILAGISEGTLPLKESEQLLGDALAILGSKVQTLRTNFSFRTGNQDQYKSFSTE